ncbi:MAG: hypothetical protein AAF360_00095 [Pseudomonadota bacterium]
MTAKVAATVSVVDRATARLKKIGGGFDRMGDRVKRATGRLGGLAVAAGSVSPALGGIASAASIGGLAALMTRTAAAGDQTAKFADRVGIAIPELGRLEFAAERSGVSQDKFRTALQKMGVRQTEALKGNKELAGLFEQLGVSTDQLRSAAPDEMLRLIADGFGRIPTQAGKAAVAQRLFEEGGLDLINMLDTGRAGIDALSAEADKYGVTSEKSARNSEAFQDAMSNLSQSTGRLANVVGEKLLPPAIRLLNWTSDFISENPGVVAGVGAAAAAFGALLGPIAAAGFAVNQVSSLAGVASQGFSLLSGAGLNLSTVFQGVGGAVKIAGAAMMANPITAIALGIAAAAVAIITNWDAIVGFFTRNFPETTAAVSEAFDGIVSTISAAWGVVSSILSAFNPVTVISDGFNAVFEFLSDLSLFDAGASIINSLIAGLKSLVPSLDDIIPKDSLIGKAIGGFGSLFGGGDDAGDGGAANAAPSALDPATIPPPAPAAAAVAQQRAPQAPDGELTVRFENAPAGTKLEEGRQNRGVKADVGQSRAGMAAA